MKKTIITILACLLAVSAAQARQPERGYRGFVEWSNALTTEDAIVINGTSDDSKTLFYSGVSTSHGYQFNPNLFLGAGLAVEFNSDHCNVPLFVQLRTDQEFGRFTPFGDLRLGYDCCDGGGVFFSPSIGYRFSWNRRLGVNVGVGLTVRGYKVDKYVVEAEDDRLVATYSGTESRTRAMFAFRIGIDF